MKNEKDFSKAHITYIKKIKKENSIIWIMRFLILALLLSLWELFAQLNVIDSFISSSPSKIVSTIYELFKEDDMLYHIGITLYETIFGFFIAVICLLISKEM